MWRALVHRCRLRTSWAASLGRLLSLFPPICCLLDCLGITVHRSHSASRILVRMNLDEKWSVRIIVPVVEEVGCTCGVEEPSETVTLNSCIAEGIIDHCSSSMLWPHSKTVTTIGYPDQGMCSNQDDGNLCIAALQGPHTASKGTGCLRQRAVPWQSTDMDFVGFGPRLEEVIQEGLVHTSTYVH